MTHFSLTIDSDDAAITDDPEGEIIRVLKRLTSRIRFGELALAGSDRGSILDSNGNSIGHWEAHQ
jgi:hypothetical protein